MLFIGWGEPFFALTRNFGRSVADGPNIHIYIYIYISFSPFYFFSFFFFFFFTLNDAINPKSEAEPGRWRGGWRGVKLVGTARELVFWFIQWWFRNNRRTKCLPLDRRRSVLCADRQGWLLLLLVARCFLLFDLYSRWMFLQKIKYNITFFSLNDHLRGTITQLNVHSEILFSPPFFSLLLFLLFLQWILRL